MESPGVTHGCQADQGFAPWGVTARCQHTRCTLSPGQSSAGTCCRVWAPAPVMGTPSGAPQSGILGGEHPCPRAALPPLPTQQNRKGGEGGFLGGMEAPYPLLPCSRVVRPLLGCTGLGTDSGHITSCFPQKTVLLLGPPKAFLVGGPTSLSPSPPLPLPCTVPSAPALAATVPGDGLGVSYLQGCRVSKGLQGLQGLSSVGLWLHGDKLQGKTCRHGVSRAGGHPRGTAPNQAGDPEGAQEQRQKGLERGQGLRGREGGVGQS